MNEIVLLHSSSDSDWIFRQRFVSCLAISDRWERFLLLPPFYRISQLVRFVSQRIPPGLFKSRQQSLRNHSLSNRLFSLRKKK